jgi:hypothetical protein
MKTVGSAVSARGAMVPLPVAEGTGQFASRTSAPGADGASMDSTRRTARNAGRTNDVMECLSLPAGSDFGWSWTPDPARWEV